MVNLYINLQHFLCSTRYYSLNLSFIYFKKLHNIPTTTIKISCATMFIHNSFTSYKHITKLQRIAI